MKGDPKTMRFDSDVEDYINKFKGDNFSERFRNLVRYFMEAEDDKKKQISMLDLDIKKREERIRKLDEILSGTRWIESQFDNLKRSIEGCQQALNATTKKAV